MIIIIIMIIIFNIHNQLMSYTYYQCHNDNYLVMVMIIVTVI